MARPITCDHCGKIDQPDRAYRWLTVVPASPTDMIPDLPLDFCSWGHLAAYAQEQHGPARPDWRTYRPPEWDHDGDPGDQQKD